MKTTLAQMLRAGGVLGAFGLACAAVLGGTWTLTADRIREAEQQRLLRQLEEVLPVGAYDNAVASDTLQVTSDALGPGTHTVYRARRDGEPVAAVLSAVAPDGYGGPIALLVGIAYDGRITGVRVTAHKETPGLGDKIDLSRNDWILDFDGRSLLDPGPRDWAVKKDGGVFDQFAGATITPRAVVKAVHRSLQYFAEHRETLFAHAEETP
ncbi:electron transport complex subunit RsxG [Sinimarinibacterium thermocellulolyticum]|uniref:Ion-translocating oxidoreductase complex subunit G n=1 Tax=Sinimarinibacterium thermocellulolyticum TaxID=3170016 RepID=A0ABV2ABI8_9GAMM